MDGMVTTGLRDTLIAGARVIDPASGFDAVVDVLVRGGLIAEIGPNLAAPGGCRADCRRGCACFAPAWSTCAPNWASPGTNIARRSSPSPAAAARGRHHDAGGAAELPAGRSMIRRWCGCCCARGEETGSLTILPYGAVTRGCAGRADGGARPAARGGRGRLHRRRQYHRPGAAHAPRPVLCAGLRRRRRAAPGGSEPRRGRCRDRGRTGDTARAAGIPAAAEAIQVARDIALARLTGGRLHFAHVSTAAALDLIRARQGGGAAASPAIRRRPISTSTRSRSASSAPMPSCRRRCGRRADRRAVVAALADGTIDAVASDHQPRDADDKRLPFAQASAGRRGAGDAAADHAGAGAWRDDFPACGRSSC